MKIAIPLHDGKFCEHFGGAEAFAFYTVDEDIRATGDRLVGTPPRQRMEHRPLYARFSGSLRGDQTC